MISAIEPIYLFGASDNFSQQGNMEAVQILSWVDITNRFNHSAHIVFSNGSNCSLFECGKMCECGYNLQTVVRRSI